MPAIDRKLKDQFDEKFELAGAFRWQLEIINDLEWITPANLRYRKILHHNGFSTGRVENNSIQRAGERAPKIQVQR